AGSVLRHRSALLVLLDRRAAGPGGAVPAGRDPGRAGQAGYDVERRRPPGRAVAPRVGAPGFLAVSAPVLSTRGLAKRFGSLVVAHAVDLTLPRGVRYALIGPNGAGKTTLVNLMTGMLQPDAGRIWLGDQDITRLGPQQRVRRGLARTFQINSLFPALSALEAVTL